MELTKGIYENMKMTMNTCLISFDTRGTCIISTFQNNKMKNLELLTKNIYVEMNNI